MQQKLVEPVLQTALKRSGKVKLIFNKDATAHVGYLLKMNTHNIVKLADEDRSWLQGVAESSHWPTNRSRSVIITINDRTFNGHLFVDQMSYALEDIRVVE